MESRRRNQIAQRLRDARFPYPKNLEDFDFTAAASVPKAKVLDLARGDFVREHENLVLIGPSGLGKTHLGLAGCGARSKSGIVPPLKPLKSTHSRTARSISWVNAGVTVGVPHHRPTLSHGLLGLSRQVIQQGYRARFTTALALMNELLSAQSHFELPKCLRLWSRFDWIYADPATMPTIAPARARPRWWGVIPVQKNP